MATKPEIIAKLTELGIAHDPNALKADLEALLPSSEGMTITNGNVTEVITKTAEAPQPGDGAVDVPRETVAKTAVVVCDQHGHPDRTYSLEMHGENFRALAEEYISDRPGWSLR